MQIKIDRRGAHCTDLKNKNRERILAFFSQNPEATYAKASEALGLSLHTVFRHVKAAEAGK